jgi:two-component system OmpR family response regulator
MDAVVRSFPRHAQTFDEQALDTDLDFTPAAVARGAFDVVATGPRRARAGNHVVLVVDADPAAGERTAALLREAGHHAAVESTPRDAARHMARLGAPALLLLEVDLPQMNGFEFVERLRRNRRLRDTPAVFFTARASRDDLVRGLRAGADGYITKSSGPSALVAALARMMG